MKAIIFSFALASVNATLVGVSNANATKPNIVFTMADDLGWYNVEWHNSDMKTPHTAQLVKEGLELDRHYAFVYCSPSRSSLMTGRVPYHVHQVNRQNCDVGQGAHKDFTFIAQKLKEVGYETAHVGKWHLGMASAQQIPKGRGFDHSLVYFEGAEDHWTQRSCVDPMCLMPVNDSTPLPPRTGFVNLTQSPYDLWRDDAPAADLAGSGYSGYMFNDFAIGVIEAHNVAKPLFLYLAPANSHSPLEAPQRFIELYPDDWYLDRRMYAAMCSFWDEVVGNVTAALRAKSMWESTLFVFSSDNGGPAYWSVDPMWHGGGGGNNWPLKGSKASNWEGGVRVPAFVSGGVLPSAMRGALTEEYIMMADWYATFCELAGCDPADPSAEAAGLPPVDSISVWPLISGVNATSPRTELPLVIDHQGRHGNGSSSVLIQGDYKLLTGLQILSFHQGPDFPNASRYGVITDLKNMQLCAFVGCLYNIRDDPTEQHNIALANLQRAKAMKDRIAELAATKFTVPSDVRTADCERQIIKNGGWYGPWLA